MFRAATSLNDPRARNTGLGKGRGSLTNVSPPGRSVREDRSASPAAAFDMATCPGGQIGIPSAATGLALRGTRCDKKKERPPAATGDRPPEVDRGASVPLLTVVGSSPPGFSDRRGGLGPWA